MRHKGLICPEKPPVNPINSGIPTSINAAENLDIKEGYATANSEFNEDENQYYYIVDTVRGQPPLGGVDNLMGPGGNNDDYTLPVDDGYLRPERCYEIITPQNEED